MPCELLNTCHLTAPVRIQLQHFRCNDLTSLCISSTCFTTAVSSDFKDKAPEIESVWKFWSASSHCPNMYSNVPLEHYKDIIKMNT